MKFNSVFINGTTLSDTWWQLLFNVQKFGRKYLITKGSFEGGYRLAFDDVSGVIMYPHQRPLSPIIPGEGVPIVPPPTNDDDIEQYFVEYLMDGNIQKNEDYKYGTFITGGEYEVPTNRGTTKKITAPNQFEWIINHFKKHGFGNEHCFLTVGYPESNFAYDIPYKNEQERKTSPCLRGLDFRIIEDDGVNYLVTKVIYRSWDLYGGFPVNMGGFTLLNEFMADQLDVEPGPLTFVSKSLHLYDFQLEPLKAWLNIKQE